ncbi:MAG TPA: Asp-tRNA(Asn)/Glu-tRNA(Gln) amidotransferase subunit GatB [Candidatus Paceibacterota bacterium]|nr:Asp-tRNA(Asn)/Glu-tRNA(Gln) amidotransferase subunit GatB [Candidatus Paceibacterota bacterium]
MYKTTIGLEIHAELKTESKMFCSCKNDPDEKTPNLNICPICLAHPGVLPTINKKAVESIVKVGLALGSKIGSPSKFDRKNYFYPDLPKGYQISQYDEPLVVGGSLNGVKLTRVHLEEDTARLQHGSDGKSSYVDYNRASLPLMELVTNPDIKSADEAYDFAKELQLILRYLEVSDADMEKGQMRVEPNISVSKTDKLGDKVELKNINSFSAVKNAIAYEVDRQIKVLEAGEKVKQETRGWDETKMETFSQRTKENAHDYRYIPEPDLPPVEIPAEIMESLKIEIPELPADKRKRFVSEYSLNDDQASTLTADRYLAAYFEEANSEKEKATPQLIFNYLTSDLLSLVNSAGLKITESKISPQHLASLVDLAEAGTLNSRKAKDLLKRMWDTGLSTEEILSQEDITQIGDEGVLKETVVRIIEANPKAVEDYRKGKEVSLQFLVGKAMGELKGRGNPELLKKLFLEYLAK